jgi:hypothetical protein
MRGAVSLPPLERISTCDASLSSRGSGLATSRDVGPICHLSCTEKVRRSRLVRGCDRLRVRGISSRSGG